MEHNRDCETTGKHYGKSQFTASHSMSTKTDKSSSQSHWHNGINLRNQKEYTDSRVLCSDSGAIQVQQTKNTEIRSTTPESDPDLTLTSYSKKA